MKTLETNLAGGPPSEAPSGFGLQLVGMPLDVRCFSAAIGWDNSRFWKPFIALTIFKVAIILGWHKHEDGSLARYDRQICARFMRRDYWKLFPHKEMERVAAGLFHDVETDCPVPHDVANMLETVGIKDGDEFEVLITATDRRPHGDRLYFLDTRENYRQETDDECYERITHKDDKLYV